MNNKTLLEQYELFKTYRYKNKYNKEQIIQRMNIKESTYDNFMKLITKYDDIQNDNKHSLRNQLATI